MTTSDFFYISVGISSLIFIVVISLVGYQIFKLISGARRSVENLDLEYKTLKTGIKFGALALINKIIGKKKGGGNN